MPSTLNCSQTRDVHAAAETARDATQAAHEALAASYSAFLDLAILRGDDTPMRTAYGRTPYPVSTIVVDSAVGCCRSLLFKAVHMTRAGQYEAGSKALLDFAAAVCADYGAAMADEYGVDE